MREDYKKVLSVSKNSYTMLVGLHLRSISFLSVDNSPISSKKLRIQNPEPLTFDNNDNQRLRIEGKKWLMMGMGSFHLLLLFSHPSIQCSMLMILTPTSLVFQQQLKQQKMKRRKKRFAEATELFGDNEKKAK